MNKIKVSADTVLAILKGIMDDADINYTITDPSAPKEWQGKKVQDVLNVEYYTFRHRPVDTEQLVAKLLEQGKDVDSLYALQRAFCILSLQSTERVFSKENDIVTVSASLEYWLQTEKVKLLEDLLEDIIVESTGIRIPVKVGSEDRQVLIAIGKLTISEIEEATEFGEMSVCDLDIDLVFYPPATTREDYKIEFAIVEDNGEIKWVHLPFNRISISNSMTQKSAPLISNAREVGNVNLSRIKTIALGFDGLKNDFVEMIAKDSLSTGENDDVVNNNKSITMKLTRGDEEFIMDCIMKEHVLGIQDDIGNETHSLVLTIRGMKDGAAQY